MTKYQVIYIGSQNGFTSDIQNVLLRHARELGIAEQAINMIDRSTFNLKYVANAPSFCLYFGDEKGNFNDLDILEKLIKDGTLTLPVVSDLKLFKEQVPGPLENINGFSLHSSNDIEKIVACVLEGLGLLRISRKIFISYKRDESSTAAVQLYERLEKNGFDVFLDTHSIRPGEPFQDELWHRMADCDVIVLLNTPGFLGSRWTTEELSQANSMQIAVLQIVWPHHTLTEDAKICVPMQLEESNFEKGVFKGTRATLVEETIEKIVEETESLRARSLASRQDALITEFVAASVRVGKKVDLQPERFITIRQANGNKLVICPAVGVPQSLTFNSSEERVEKILSTKGNIFLLYDHINVRDKWLKHLGWLENHLPVKTIKIVEAESWLRKH